MENALQPIQFLLHYSPSRSSKVNNFYFVWKSVFYFLLLINSNFGSIAHRFWDMASFLLKNALFPTFFRSTTNLKMSPLNCFPQILYAESLDKKVFLYDPTLSHNISVTYRQTDDNDAKDIVQHSCSASIKHKTVAKHFGWFLLVTTA